VVERCDVPHEELARLFRGALGVERTSSGAVPVRLPDGAWLSLPDAGTREAFRMPLGVRLAFATRATTLELDVIATRLMAPSLRVELFVDGDRFAERRIAHTTEPGVTEDGELVSESAPVPVTLRFDVLPGRDKEVEIWLPSGAVIELRMLRADAPVRQVPDASPCWIHYGSSISHGDWSMAPSDTWPAIAARRAGLDLFNLAVPGGCHLDPFVARAIRDTPATSISLKVGINIAIGDTFKYRTLVAALHGFLDTIRDGHKATPILVVSPIICPILEDSPGPVLPAEEGFAPAPCPAALHDKDALSLRRMRELLRDVVESRSAHDPQLRYLDGLDLFGPLDLADLPDGIHPSPAGYRRIGERFAAIAFGERGLLRPATTDLTPPSPRS
jgi:hypothetical protein